jgi:hypothetical protein
MRTLARLSLGVLAFTFASACGGGSGDDDPQGPNGNENMTAEIDGDDWAGMGNAARSAGGIYTITAAQGTEGISLQLFNIPGPGTYPLGMNATGFGGTGLVSLPGAGWSTPLNGRSGSVTLTTVTDTRIIGTFQYDATPLNGSATGTREVTNGEFDMLLQTAGTWAPPDAWDGNRLNGRIGTDTIVGATMVVVLNGDDLLFNAGDLEHVLTITLQDLAGANAYTFSNSAPLRQIMLSDINGGDAYMTAAGAPGSITVSSANANRIAGSYTATLTRVGGSETITVSGTFDVGVPHF